jgi:hypothetical protein
VLFCWQADSCSGWELPKRRRLPQPPTSPPDATAAKRCRKEHKYVDEPAMSSKYQTGHQVPDEFPRILKDFVREILRYQPKNIYQFGAEYFEDKLHGSSNLSPLQMSEEQLIQYLHNVFLSADADGSGLLDKKEFKKLMKSSDMHIPKNAVKLLYTEAILFDVHVY